METKLTLKLDKSIIESAKKYAENTNRSLSKLVENYFRNLTMEKESPKKHSQLVESLSGIISEKEAEEWALEDPKIRYILKKE
ncbi:MAG: DUF6364 family protein [Spirochaetaceae bacterium]|jgi:hypothetical protein|nr:DUF6364 family protein [Spirochaetaceae bacterium]